MVSYFPLYILPVAVERGWNIPMLQFVYWQDTLLLPFPILTFGSFFIFSVFFLFRGDTGLRKCMYGIWVVDVFSEEIFPFRFFCFL
jgi:hypothetical protein